MASLQEGDAPRRNAEPAATFLGGVTPPSQRVAPFTGSVTGRRKSRRSSQDNWAAQYPFRHLTDRWRSVPALAYDPRRISELPAFRDHLGIAVIAARFMAFLHP